MIDPTSEKIIKDILAEKDRVIEKLEYRNRKLKEYIKNRLDIDEGDIDSIEGFEEEKIATKGEVTQFEKNIERYEEYANSFNYGRGEKVAESL